METKNQTFESSAVKEPILKAPRKPNTHSIAHFIEQYYPEYWGIQHYSANQCAPFCKTTEQWGIVGNFGKVSIEVNGLVFKNSEQLFQLMKFREAGILKELYLTPAGRALKMKAKHYETDHRRPDWGNFILDAMKFCLMTKYEQSSEFRDTLEQTKGLFIVEDQTKFPKKTADAWGTKLVNNEYVGPNILGRMLMELRDNGKLEYNLPDDALDFIELLKESLK